MAARAILRLLAVAASMAAEAAETRPHRIVSANLCADRLVLALADRADIVSVSPYAADPRLSTVAGLARGIAVNRGEAEEIAALDPDLVVLTARSHTSSAALLKRLGLPVYILPAPDSIEGVRNAIAGLAKALGVPERGKAMIERIDAGLAAIERQAPLRRGVLYQPGGWSTGQGSIADDVLRSAGYDNIAAKAGLKGFGALPLETLLAAGPDMIAFERIEEGGASLASGLLDHPALRTGGARIVVLPASLWGCADESVVATARLIAGTPP